MDIADDADKQDDGSDPNVSACVKAGDTIIVILISLIIQGKKHGHFGTCIATYGNRICIFVYDFQSLLKNSLKYKGLFGPSLATRMKREARSFKRELPCLKQLRNRD